MGLYCWSESSNIHVLICLLRFTEYFSLSLWSCVLTGWIAGGRRSQAHLSTVGYYLLVVETVSSRGSIGLSTDTVVRTYWEHVLGLCSCPNGYRRFRPRSTVSPVICQAPTLSYNYSFLHVLSCDCLFLLFSVCVSVSMSLSGVFLLFVSAASGKTHQNGRVASGRGSLIGQELYFHAGQLLFNAPVQTNWRTTESITKYSTLESVK